MFNIDIIKLLRQFQYNPEEPLIFNSGFSCSCSWGSWGFIRG